MTDITGGSGYVERLYRLKQSIQSLEEIKLTKETAKQSQQVQALNETKSSMKNSQMALVETDSPQDRAFFQQYLDIYSLQTEDHQQAILASQKTIDSQKKAVEEAHMESERWKGLYEEQKEIAKQEVNVTEQKQMDENAVLLYKPKLL